MLTLLKPMVDSINRQSSFTLDEFQTIIFQKQNKTNFQILGKCLFLLNCIDSFDLSKTKYMKFYLITL